MARIIKLMRASTVTELFTSIKCQTVIKSDRQFYLL